MPDRFSDFVVTVKEKYVFNGASRLRTSVGHFFFPSDLSFSVVAGKSDRLRPAGLSPESQCQQSGTPKSVALLYTVGIVATVTLTRPGLSSWQLLATVNIHKTQP